MVIRTAIGPAPAVPAPYAVTRLFGEREAGGAGVITIEALGPGATSPTNRVAAETITFLLGGRLSCNGSTSPLVSGDAMFHPPGCRRSFCNVGSELALLFTVQATTDTERSETGADATPQRVSLQVAEDPSLDRDGGFISMGVRWLATRETVGTCNVALGTSTFEPGGQHELHRHPHAVEFLLVVGGAGVHLTEDGATPLTHGGLVLIPTGEWHGFCTDPGVTTRTVFGYLGAASLAEAGYELKTGGRDD